MSGPCSPECSGFAFKMVRAVSSLTVDAVGLAVWFGLEARMPSAVVPMLAWDELGQSRVTARLALGATARAATVGGPTGCTRRSAPMLARNARIKSDAKNSGDFLNECFVSGECLGRWVCVLFLI